MFYDKNNTLYAHKTHTNNGIEIIAATFQLDVRKTIHVVAIYKPPTIHIEIVSLLCKWQIIIIIIIK